MTNTERAEFIRLFYPDCCDTDELRAEFDDMVNNQQDESVDQPTTSRICRLSLSLSTSSGKRDSRYGSGGLRSATGFCGVRGFTEKGAER